MVLPIAAFGLSVALIIAPKISSLLAVMGAIFYTLVRLVRVRSGCRRASVWVVMPAFYVALMGCLGVMFYEPLADSLGRGATDSTYRALTYIATLFGIFLAVSILPSRARELPASYRIRRGENDSEGTRVLGWLCVASTAIGLAGAALMLSGINLNSFIDDPLSSRREIGAAASSPYAWLAYRFLLVAAAAATGWVCKKVEEPRRAITRKIVLVNLPYFLLLAAYGGRLLPLLVVLNALVIFWVLVRRPPIIKLIIGALVGYVVVVWYAAYRYFSYFGRGVTWERFRITFLTQSAGEFSDAQRVSDIYSGNNQGVSNVLIGQFFDSFPDPLLALFDIPSYGGAQSFGAFASRTLGEEEIGGIRVGAVGEVNLSFGLLGSLALGLMVGALMWLAMKWLADGRVVLAAVLTTQMTATMILGFASLVSVIPLILLTLVLAMFFGVRREESRAAGDGQAVHSNKISVYSRAVA